MRIVLLSFAVVCFFNSCRHTVESIPSMSDAIEFQLSSPLITTEKTLFKDSTLLILESPYPGAVLWFQALDIHTQSPTAAIRYESPISLKENTILRAFATHTEYQTSDTVSLEVFKIKHPLHQSQISISPGANAAYLGKGNSTLINDTKGSVSFRNSDEWLGFDQPKITIDLVLNPQLSIDKVLISSLIDQDAWIFPLAAIEVKGGNKVLGSYVNNDANSATNAQLKTFMVKIPNNHYNKLTIELTSVINIPDWHPGKGTQAWLFIDQILVE